MTKRLYTEYPEEKKNRFKEAKLKSKFGLSLKEYQAMFDEQQGCCAICGKHQNELSYSLAVDHCHNIGVIRGLLCRSCNLHLDFYERYSNECQQYLDEAHRLRMLGRRLYIRNPRE